MDAQSLLVAGADPLKSSHVRVTVEFRCPVCGPQSRDVHLLAGTDPRLEILLAHHCRRCGRLLRSRKEVGEFLGLPGFPTPAEWPGPFNVPLLDGAGI